MMEELKRLAEAATQEPYVYDGKFTVEIRHSKGTTYFRTQPEDAAYIVAACNGVPALIKEIGRLREALRQVTQFKGQFDLAKDGNLQTAVAIASNALGVKP